ncbi:MAG: hypothetical protein WBN10_03275, partial [Polyangiales bacterium]
FPTCPQAPGTGGMGGMGGAGGDAGTGGSDTNDGGGGGGCAVGNREGTGSSTIWLALLVCGWTVLRRRRPRMDPQA